jgi:hypothetical protein
MRHSVRRGAGQVGKSNLPRPPRAPIDRVPMRACVAQYIVSKNFSLT